MLKIDHGKRSELGLVPLCLLPLDLPPSNALSFVLVYWHLTDWILLGHKSCRTKVPRIFRTFVPNFVPNLAPNFFRGFEKGLAGRGWRRKGAKKQRKFIPRIMFPFSQGWHRTKSAEKRPESLAQEGSPRANPLCPPTPCRNFCFLKEFLCFFS